MDNKHRPTQPPPLDEKSGFIVAETYGYFRFLTSFRTETSSVIKKLRLSTNPNVSAT